MLTTVKDYQQAQDFAKKTKDGPVVLRHPYPTYEDLIAIIQGWDGPAAYYLANEDFSIAVDICKDSFVYQLRHFSPMPDRARFALKIVTYNEVETLLLSSTS